MATDEIRESVQNFMPFSFDIVNKISGRILLEERRYIYTTPKSFLELIKLFKVMLAKKEAELQNNKDRYETGVIKLNETGEIVAKLEEELKVKSVEVAEKSKLADEQAEIVGKEKVKVEAESAKAAIEADKCAVIKREVESESKTVKAELAMALPLVEAAMEALKVLNVKDF
jgi:dynein heavy chain